MINLGFDGRGRLVGIEVLAAASRLSWYLFGAWERPDAAGA
ncbi:hypothetical protein ACWCXH_24655 [Kitasatospora sp. NPDC001660]